MSDLLEQNLREMLSEHAAQIDPAASARLRAIDYRPVDAAGLPSRPSARSGWAEWQRRWSPSSP
jgi:hypothetical protein